MEARPPAVAGAFYPADPSALAREVREYMGGPGPHRSVFGAIVPHAGYVYSGAVAGAVYARMTPARTVILLGPNHTGRGAPAALDPHDAWRTPLGKVPIDGALAARLEALCPSLERDGAAHAREHSLEVQLPFLQAGNPSLSIVPICLGAPSLALCREIGEACAAVAGEAAAPIPIVASSDMNHYESREIGDAKNAFALAAIERIDPEALFGEVLARDISMCGFLPATALLFAARRGGIRRAEIVARADSGDRTGDVESVVGYAGILVG
jgi:AmmeMemoRadiSam system protein B